MGVMQCPHCEESISSLTRTGEKKYSCGQCNMVIKYDDLRPNLDEMEVIDKRDNGDSDNGSNNSDSPPAPPGGDMPAPPAPDQPEQNSSISEREKIYQRGTEGLKEIKRERLQRWLDSSDGVGAQTEQRILMVFDRNESVHKNPHVLYNLLDDELNASASYVNTIVQDTFSPEEEHSDLLTNQGYTPWFNRPGQGPSNQGGMGQGGPMNATGANRFDPQQGGQGGGGQRQQQNQQQNQQGGQTDDSVSRREAEMMMQEAVSQANQQGNRSALMDGLSDATDEALREMATNVGGLAGTFQRVIDEALVQYARENPEWVIENMGVLQKVLGATEDMDSSGGSSQPKESEEDRKVDDALSQLTGGQETNDSPSRQPEPDPEPEPEPTENTDPILSDPDEPEQKDPDIDEDMKGDSGFNPEFDTSNFKAQPEHPEKTEDDAEEANTQESSTEPVEAEQHTETEPSTSTDDDGEGFDEIFGEMAEDE